MDSIDTGHVNPNWDPTNLWMLPLNKLVTVGQQPPLTLRVSILEADRVFTQMVYGNQLLKDWLNLDKPCVVLRHPSGSPALTLTVRVILLHDAFPTCGLQITSDMPTIPREAK